MNPLYSRFGRSTRERGSVLVICMVLAALGTIGVAAWMSLVNARSHQIEASFTAVERRVARENSRALAHRALYANALSANAPFISDTTVELPDKKGRAVIRAFTTVPLISNTVGFPSRNGGTPLSSHSTDVAVDIGIGNDTARWTYRLRNYHPALAGDLLALHAPVIATDVAPLVSGNLRVKGRAVFWDAVMRDLGNGLRADEYLLPKSIAGATSFTTTDGTPTLPLNYPHYLRTTGVTSSGPAYRGELELFSASINPQNSYEARIPNLPTVKKLNGNIKKSETNGAKTKPTSDSTLDAALLQLVETGTPKQVVDGLSQYTDLSSPVLVATVLKNNPKLKNRDLLQIFDRQAGIPEDALTDVMGAIDETDYDNVLDAALIDMNDRNGTYYNAPGNGMVQIFLDRTDLNFAVVEGVTRLRLFGQPNSTRAAAAAKMTPFVVLVNNSGGQNLARVELFHGNLRPVIVLMVSAPASPALADVVYKGNNAFPIWRVIFDLQNTGLKFDTSGIGGTTIRGGIRTNHRLIVPSGTLTIERDRDAAALAPLLSRDAWIECVRN